MTSRELRERLMYASWAARMNVLASAYMRGEIGERAFLRMFPRGWRDAGGAMLPGDLRSSLVLMEVLAGRYGTVTDSPKRWSAMPDEFAIYRGGFAFGPCWTLSEKVAESFVSAQRQMREVARIFAERGDNDRYESLAHFDLNGEPGVMAIDIHKTEVIGFFWKRGEQEVVLGANSWMERRAAA